MENQVAGLKSITSREEILSELMASCERDNVLGLFLAGSDEMLTTSIVRIDNDSGNEKMIYVQKTDLHGYLIDSNPILLGEIRSLIPFRTLFNDPVYVRIRERKSRQQDGLAA